MREDKKMPSTPLIILGMTGALMLTAVCVTPPIKTPKIPTHAVVDIDERAQPQPQPEPEPEFTAIHCTHDALPSKIDMHQYVHPRVDDPVPGPILPAGQMRRGNINASQAEVDIPHSGGEVIIRPARIHHRSDRRAPGLYLPSVAPGRHGPIQDQ